MHYTRNKSTESPRIAYWYNGNDKHTLTTPEPQSSKAKDGEKCFMAKFV